MPALNTRHRQPFAALWYTALPAILIACIVLTLGIVFATSTALASANIAGFSALIMFVSVMGTILAIAYPILFYLLFSYEMGEHAITINSGIIFRQHETINFERIQVVDNERGPLLMLFMILAGLANCSSKRVTRKRSRISSLAVLHKGPSSLARSRPPGVPRAPHRARLF
ncbi:MAG: hypothetical protein Athens041674_857 [Parcubacteria group bacterium Athens0416_74]|nr:MAG: hypothetical protein Athens041674_857 [Parcubacteria group bacterium Athens0416_74]